MAANKKKVKVQKMPFWAIYFTCTDKPLTDSKACPDHTTGPYSTYEAAVAGANKANTSYGGYNSALIVQAASVASSIKDLTFTKV